MPVPLLGFSLQSFIPPVQAALVSEAVALLPLDAFAARSDLPSRPNATT
jgi:hypothetical protein